MNRYKLSNLTFSLIFMCLLNSSLLGIIFPYVLWEVKTSVFISLGISYLLGLVLIWIFLRIFNFLPDKGIFEKIEYVFPKIISKIISLVLIGLVFLMVTFMFWRLVTFIAAEFLVETPNMLITFLLAAPLLYLIFYDFDVIGRFSVFCVFIGTILLIFNVITLMSEMDMSNLKPLLNNDFIHLSKASITFIFIFLTPAFLTLIIPKDNVINNEKIDRSIFISYTVGFVGVALVFFTIISVLGIEISNLYTFPSYIVLKTMNVLSFVQNIENIGILIWVLFITFGTGFGLLFLKSGLGEVFKLNEKKMRIFTIIFIFIPFLFIVIESLPYEIYLNKYKYVFAPLILYASVFLLILIVYLIAKVKLLIKKNN